MKVGDIVTHSEYPDRLRIFSISTPIVTCEEIDADKIWYAAFGAMMFQRVVCHMENLTISGEPAPQLQAPQLPLF
jgi:hypothetical protein